MAAIRWDCARRSNGRTALDLLSVKSRRIWRGVFLLGLISAWLRLHAAYRFAGVTLAITMLIARQRPAWVVAEHRLVEVSVGIATGLIVTAVWPLRVAKPAPNGLRTNLPQN